MSEARGTGRKLALAAACAAVLLLPALVVAAGGPGPQHADRGGLAGQTTGRQAELRETVPITREPGAAEAAVLSLPLPRVKRGDRIRFGGEVTVTTTCVEPTERCIGRPYRFDPRLRARIVIAQEEHEAAGGTYPVSGAVGLSCEQTRPNRNHHCPLVISDATTIPRPGKLPCPPASCRLNMVLSAHHRVAQPGQVVVVGADRPDGSVDGGKARLTAAIARARAKIGILERRTRRRSSRALPASFDGGQRVVYSERLKGLEAGDVLLVEARQRTKIRELPYFVASKVVLATRPNARNAGPFTRRIASRQGTATETNGFNCTIGRSAFRSPCTTRKAGLVVIERAPGRGQLKPLYLNLVSRAFPKLAQARRGSYPPARVLRGGGLTVTRLRARER